MFNVAVLFNYLACTAKYVPICFDLRILRVLRSSIRSKEVFLFLSAVTDAGFLLFNPVI